MPAAILSIGTSVPRYRTNQQELVGFMKKYLAKDQRSARKVQVLFNLSGIENRYSVIPDFGTTPEKFEFFPPSDDLEPFPTTSKRMATFQEQATQLAHTAAAKCLEKVQVSSKEITHVITVSCTGMFAPGLDIELVESLKLNTSVERTGINFMGCYGAFNALKVAKNTILADPHSKVLIVSVELCSLHFQKKLDEDTLLSNTLFGDGAAAVLVADSTNRRPALDLVEFHNDLVLAGKKEMGWFVKDLGFEMRLSGEVPRVIKNGINALADRLMEKLELPNELIGHYAIHPGGRKILEVIEASLGIAPEQNWASHEVMRKYGNMSSPTVLFVLEEIWLRGLKEENPNILSFAFGPGLTMESMLLRARL